jgi:hypothetical protein
LVQAFLKKWWVESDFKAPNLPLSLRLKGSGDLTVNIQYFVSFAHVLLIFYSLSQTVVAEKGTLFDVTLSICATLDMVIMWNLEFDHTCL